MSALSQALQEGLRELELQWAQEEERELELTEAERHARDPVGWLNSGHVWIASRFDTAGKELAGRKLRPVKLALFPTQGQLIDAWLDLPHLAKTGELVFRNVVDEKSRQIGETWAVAGIICWALHYHRVTGLAINRDGARIDDGGERSTVDSLFGRIRYIDQRLDRGKLPGLAAKLTFRPFSRDPAKIENPARGSFVVGEGQSDDPGRGSTYDFVAGDEFAFLLHSEKVHAALDEACPDGKLYLSTVNGDGNAHARLAKERPAGWTYLRQHWSQHPVYSVGLHVAGAEPGCALCEGNRDELPWNPSEPRAHRYPGKPTSPWYDLRVIGKTDEQVANELDIDRERAKAGRVYPEFRSDLHVVAEGIPYDPALQIELAADYGLDATSIPVMQDAPGELRVVGILETGHLFGTSGTPDATAAALVDYLRGLGVPERLLEHQWLRRMYAVGDPSGHNKTMETGRPFVAAYRRHGFYFAKPPSRLTARITPSVTAVKLLLTGVPKPVRVCGVNAAAFVEHMRENTWRTGPDGRVLGLEDDVHNHCARAFAYFCLAKFPPQAEPRPASELLVEREYVPSALQRRRDRAVSGGFDAEPLAFDQAL